jgi:hypothetical protein
MTVGLGCRIHNIWYTDNEHYNTFRYFGEVLKLYSLLQTVTFSRRMKTCVPEEGGTGMCSSWNIYENCQRLFSNREGNMKSVNTDSVRMSHIILSKYNRSTYDSKYGILKTFPLILNRTVSVHTTHMYTYFCIYTSSPWSRILPEKQIVARLVKRCPSFHRSQGFIADIQKPATGLID